MRERKFLFVQRLLLFQRFLFLSFFFSPLFEQALLSKVCFGVAAKRGAISGRKYTYGLRSPFSEACLIDPRRGGASVSYLKKDRHVPFHLGEMDREGSPSASAGLMARALLLLDVTLRYVMGGKKPDVEGRGGKRRPVWNSLKWLLVARKSICRSTPRRRIVRSCASWGSSVTRRMLGFCLWGFPLEGQ